MGAVVMHTCTNSAKFTSGNPQLGYIMKGVFRYGKS